MDYPKYQLYTGKDDQFSFFRNNERKFGVALWYDF